jgi:hypothetical protein
MNRPGIHFAGKRPNVVGTIIHSAPIDPIHPDATYVDKSDKSGRYE